MSPSAALAQNTTAPRAGLHEATPRVHALRGARIFVMPDRVIDDGTLLVRDGRVVAAGKDIELPADAIVHDVSGRTIYPAFIDAYGEVAATTSTTEHTAGGYWNPRAAPQIRASGFWKPDDELERGFRSQGFAMRLVAPRGAILRGRSVLVTTADAAHAAVVKDKVALHVQLEPLERSYREGFPNSIMGAVAFVRQAMCDARWYRQALQSTEHDPAVPPPAASLVLQTLAPYAHGEGLVILDAEDEFAVLRADTLAREFGLKTILRGSGSEYRRLEAVAATGQAVIVPLQMPGLPDVSAVESSLEITLEELMHWDLAPENAARLRAAGVTIALTAHGLKRPADFLPALRRAVRRGLAPNEALRALTMAPATMLDVADRVGTLEAGKSANFIVADGDLFDSDARVRETWIEGRRYEVKEKEDGAAEGAKKKWAEDDNEPQRALFEVNFPLGAHGRLASRPRRPQGLLFRNATVWTCGDRGVLENADVLIRGGTILEVGRELEADGVEVIDCRGQHLTPGLIDCHSHMAITGGITDSGKTTTGEVRIADVINSDDPDIYRQLAGGVTCVNLLPGSDNTIAGQSQVVKLRWGALPEEMKFERAPAGMKLALGENVKQSNWGDDFRVRYPQTRMGVEQLLLDRWQAASHYLRTKADEATRSTSTRPHRRNLELEALAEVLEGKRRLHCHAYRQDEILAYVRLCAALRIKPGTLHHASDGYKLADLLATQQVGVSSFSDWWAYKFEAYEAIPYNAAMLAGAGVLSSINSDDPEMARRLNMEAAKAIKYGGLAAEDALRLITLWPARQLGIDRRVGSLEAGKDADLALWSGPPLSATSRCEQTWLDGRCYFDRAEDAALREQARRSHAALIQRVLEQSGS